VADASRSPQQQLRQLTRR
jgi:hypothetical protein